MSEVKAAPRVRTLARKASLPSLILNLNPKFNKARSPRIPCARRLFNQGVRSEAGQRLRSRTAPHAWPQSMQSCQSFDSRFRAYVKPFEGQAYVLLWAVWGISKPRRLRLTEGFAPKYPQDSALRSTVACMTPIKLLRLDSWADAAASSMSSWRPQCTQRVLNFPSAK